MKFKKQVNNITAEADMTPMIDMTFQLIAFFMVLLNFGEGEQDARIKLPSSQLAKPPDAPLQSPLVLQVTERSTVLFGGEELPLEQLRRQLLTERRLLELNGKSPTEATVIIRADANTKTGFVQEVIQKCQENAFEKFALRVQQGENKPPGG